MQRIYCENCTYPKKTCVCDAVQKINLKINTIILQHPKEAKHAKNTVRLVKLVVPQTVIIDIEDGSEIAKLKSTINKNNSCLIYPSENSTALESIEHSTQKDQVENLLFIDANWKQAYSVFQRFSWLRILPSYHFEYPPQQNYQIRKAKKPTYLSTIEAVSYSHQVLSGENTEALDNVFQKFKAFWPTTNS